MNTKPIYVSGYVRNKKIETKLPSVNVAALIIAGVMVLVLAVHWRLTLSTAVLVSLGVFAKKYYQFINDPGRLVVNYYGMGQVGNIFNNVKEMVWGQ